MSEDLCDLPAHELVQRLKKGQVSAVEILDSTLSRIDAVEGRAPTTTTYDPDPQDLEKIHAYITVTAERARLQAETVDQLRSKGEDPGVLAGVPLAIKDIFCAKGTPSTAGSRILENFISPYSATPVRRMEAAGAVTIGKVNLDEFTFGSSNESSAFLPPPGNPWNPTCVPGGSSGGSAAAVAVRRPSHSALTQRVQSVNRQLFAVLWA